MIFAFVSVAIIIYVFAFSKLHYLLDSAILKQSGISVFFLQLS